MSSNKAKSKRAHFEKLIKSMKLFCQIFCAAPVVDQSCGKITTKRRLHNLWCLIILLYIYVVNYMQAQNLPPKRPTIEKALYFSEFITNCIIATALISSAYYYGEQYQLLPQKLKFLDIITAEYELGPPMYDILLLELRLFIFAASTFLFACFAIDLVFYDYNILVSIRSCGAYNLPNVLATLNLAQFWLALRFISLLYKRLNDALKRLQSFGYDYAVEQNYNSQINGGLKIMPWTSVSNWYGREFAASPGKTVLMAEFLDYLRGLYSELDGLTNNMAEIYGCIIVLNFFGSFLNLTIQYFAVYKFYDQPNYGTLSLFVYKLLWIVLHTGRILFILLTQHMVTKEKSRTYYLLNELPTPTREIEHAINRFHFQLMVRRAAETACGIIDLDLLFLGGFNAALATYVIFLIQIDLGNVSLNMAPNRTMPKD